MRQQRESSQNQSTAVVENESKINHEVCLLLTGGVKVILCVYEDELVDEHGTQNPVAELACSSFSLCFCNNHTAD